MPNVPYDEDSRTANLCVLLHGALKTSTLCALVQVAANGSRNWFGILFSHADSKKKFCLEYMIRRSIYIYEIFDF